MEDNAGVFSTKPSSSQPVDPMPVILPARLPWVILEAPIEPLMDIEPEESDQVLTEVEFSSSSSVAVDPLSVPPEKPDQLALDLESSSSIPVAVESLPVPLPVALPLVDLEAPIEPQMDMEPEEPDQHPMAMESSSSIPVAVDSLPLPLPVVFPFVNLEAPIEPLMDMEPEEPDQVPFFVAVEDWNQWETFEVGFNIFD